MYLEALCFIVFLFSHHFAKFSTETHLGHRKALTETHLGHRKALKSVQIHRGDQIPTAFLFPMLQLNYVYETFSIKSRLPNCAKSVFLFSCLFCVKRILYFWLSNSVQRHSPHSLVPGTNAADSTVDQYSRYSIQLAKQCTVQH